MRALAITGIDTALMMLSIMSGSLMRETPPCARMSAGTRSRAITATAPASSAILACSGVTTSMMTPPLSISAMPRLTREVPVVGVGVLSWADTGFASFAGVASWSGGRAGERGAAPDSTGSGRALQNGQLVVDLEGARHLGVAGQPEPPHHPL